MNLLGGKKSHFPVRPSKHLVSWGSPRPYSRILSKSCSSAATVNADYEIQLHGFTFPLGPSFDAKDKTPSSVLDVIPPPFFTETERLRVTIKVCPFAALKRSLTCALTSFSFAILGSCTNAPPRVLGGWSPVVAYLRHSMMVYRAVKGDVG
jgi:hypothetical protein